MMLQAATSIQRGSLMQRMKLFTTLWILRTLRPFSRPRFYLCVSLGALVLLLCQSLNSVARKARGFPAVPLDIRNNITYQTPPKPLGFHKPVIAIDLNNARGDIQNKGRVLILTPLHNAAKHIHRYFEHIIGLTYSHELIDLGFLVGDTSDETLALLTTEADRLQRGEYSVRSIQVISRDFGSVIPQNIERHSFAVQVPRRKMMARARNYLLHTSLKPDHDWVFWRDVDVEEHPHSILEDLMSYDKDILVPNVWFRYQNDDGVDVERGYDLNAWLESPKSLDLAKFLNKDDVLFEGYEDIITNRLHMADMGTPGKNSSEAIPLDGVGGVSIMVKADVHRSGINFPCYAFEHQLETEGFAKMAKRAGYQVFGLPDYIIWHVNG